MVQSYLIDFKNHKNRFPFIKVYDFNKTNSSSPIYKYEEISLSRDNSEEYNDFLKRVKLYLESESESIIYCRFLAEDIDDNGEIIPLCGENNEEIEIGKHVKGFVEKDGEVVEVIDLVDVDETFFGDVLKDLENMCQ